MRAFACPNCSQLVFFENTACLNCGTELGLRWPERELGALDGPRCANFETAACNWQAGAPGELCFSCGLTRTRPADKDVEGLAALRSAEAAKRRLLFELGELGLPIEGVELRPALERHAAGHDRARGRGRDPGSRRGRRPAPRAHAPGARRALPDAAGALPARGGPLLLDRALPRRGAPGARPGALRRRARGLRSRARAPLRRGFAGRLAGAPRERLRDHASGRGLGGDVRPLPAHARYIADGRRLRGGGERTGRARRAQPSPPHPRTNRRASTSSSRAGCR